MSAPFYNEGLGHGAFVAMFQSAGNVILENFSRDRAIAHDIQQNDQIGAPLKFAGVAGPVTGSITAQLNVVGGVTQPILLGDRFTAPATHGGGVWIVMSAGEQYAVGDYWKATLQIKQQQNAGF